MKLGDLSYLMQALNQPIAIAVNKPDGCTGKFSPAILAAMGLSEQHWEGQVRSTESIYWRAIGSVDSLMDLTEQLGQKWLRGIRAVMALERPS